MATGVRKNRSKQMLCASGWKNTPYEKVSPKFFFEFESYKISKSRQPTPKTEGHAT